MEIKTLEELLVIMKCSGKTPNCIGRNCIECRAELLLKYFDIKLKDEFIK